MKPFNIVYISIIDKVTFVVKTEIKAMMITYFYSNSMIYILVVIET